MSQGHACTDRTHRHSWRVIHYRCNFSAFNGYHRTPSEYSLIRCTVDGKFWRTKATYVETLPQFSAMHQR